MAIPEITKDIDKIMLVSVGETPKAKQIKRPGVTIGTIIASKCWKAAKKRSKVLVDHLNHKQGLNGLESVDWTWV